MTHERTGGDRERRFFRELVKERLVVLASRGELERAMLIEGDTEHGVRVTGEGLRVTHEEDGYTHRVSLNLALAEKRRIFDRVVHAVLLFVHSVVLLSDYALRRKAARTGILSPLNKVIRVHHNKIYSMT